MQLERLSPDQHRQRINLYGTKNRVVNRTRSKAGPNPPKGRDSYADLPGVKADPDRSRLLSGYVLSGLSVLFGSKLERFSAFDPVAPIVAILC